MPQDALLLSKIIKVVESSRQSVIQAIAVLEACQAGSAPSPWNASSGKRRGRTGMSDAERAIVSARMRKYWAERRALREAQEGGSRTPAVRPDFPLHQ